MFYQELLLPPLQALCNFRESVRSMARETLVSKEQNAKEFAKNLLALSDRLRDDVLPELGIKLEDFQGRFVISTLYLLNFYWTRDYVQYSKRIASVSITVHYNVSLVP